jgi:hypothetical protein
VSDWFNLSKALEGSTSFSEEKEAKRLCSCGRFDRECL